MSSTLYFGGDNLKEIITKYGQIKVISSIEFYLDRIKINEKVYTLEDNTFYIEKFVRKFSWEKLY